MSHGLISLYPLSIGFAMSRFGKKWTMISLGVPFAIGIVMIMVAQSSVVLIIGRLLYGFASGSYALLVPSYTSELSEQSIKGALGSLQQLMATFGVLLVGILGKYLEWRTMTGVFLCIPVLMGLLLIFMPDSPVYLVTKHRMEDARKALLFFRGPKSVLTNQSPVFCYN